MQNMQLKFTTRSNDFEENPFGESKCEKVTIRHSISDIRNNKIHIGISCRKRTNVIFNKENKKIKLTGN